MNYRIDKAQSQTAYLQLYAQLRRDIVNGVFAYGEKLPSKRLLAEETGVSLITVEHTYGILCEEGYVESRERKGYFVAYRRGEVLPLAEKTVSLATERLPSLPKGDFPFSVLAKAMRRVVTVYGEDLLQKSPNHGVAPLREAIARYLSRNNGITAHPEQIVVGAGAEYLYGLILQLLGREQIYGLENPGYEKIGKVYEAGGGICRLLTMGPDGIATEALSTTDATLLHVTPFHSYPSGITATASKRREYLDFVAQRKGFLIEDNYDSELTPSKKNEETLFALDNGQRVIYLNTFSHTIAPSVRVGYMVLPQSLLPSFQEKLGFYSCTVPLFEQLLLTELLNSGDFERHINRVRRARRKTQK
ncbi:MAG: PLP-dependent aminotransferase family protein [Clostridia bacterium]|nr:PLP-dependent aminotransferase family protein [Clostridia bacterium]